MSTQPRFHLAIPVDDLDEARRFYVNVLGCSIGRFDQRWVDYDFFGHQLTTHLVDGMPVEAATNLVDGKAIPVRHFGVVLAWQDWHDLRDDLLDRQVDFLVEPGIRFAGESGEQATLFLTDPCGNVLEFKAFRNPDNLFLRG